MAPKTADRTPYYTVAEAAKILRVHRQTVYDMIERGELVHRRVGRHIRIPRTALETDEPRTA